MDKQQLSRDYEIKGCIVGVAFSCDKFSIGNDGIGAYEYWGAKGFDRGRNYLEEFNVFDVTVFSERRNTHVTPSARLLSVIEEMIYNDDSVSEQLMERLDEEAEWEKEYYAEMRAEEKYYDSL